MKHNFLSYALMLVAALSCTPVELTQKQEGERETDVDGKTVIGAEICEDMARTTMGTLSGNEYPIYWSAGDAINVNGVASAGITISENDGKHATFAFASAFTDNTLYAVYPASRVVSNTNAGTASVLLPSVQTYASNNFDASTALMVGDAAINAASIPFRNVMAYLQIIPGGSATNISRVTVTARGGEKMCGLFNVDFTNKKLVAPSPDPEAGLISTRTASVVCDSPVSAGKPLIVAIPAQTYTQGIMVIIQDTEGHITQKSNKTANLIFEAGKIYLMDGITFEASAKNASSMTIDGQFNDWLLAPSVSYSLPEGAQYSDVRELKLAADDDNVYMYMELFEPTDLLAQSRAMDIHIDADADHSTGCDLGLVGGQKYFNQTGLEWYIESGDIKIVDKTQKQYGNLQNTNVYKWTGPAGVNVFGGYLVSQNGKYGTPQLNAAGNYTIVNPAGGGNIGRYEVKLNRKYFGIYGDKVNLGVKYMEPGSGWPIRGLLPQGKYNGSTRTVTDMAVLALKSTAYPSNPITIDGIFSDWDNINGWTAEFDLHEKATVYKELTQMKMVSTSSKVYAYFRMTYPGSTEYLPSNLILDSDGNPNTGYMLESIDNFSSGKLFNPCGGTWYIEGSLQSETGTIYNLNQFTMYKFNGNNGDSPFDHLVDYGAFDETKMKSRYKLSNGIMEIEVEFDRYTYNIEGTKVGLGFKIMHNDVKPTNNTEKVWMAHGIIPQKSTTGTFVAGDLLRVNIPPYSK